ncbi:MAG: glycine cleavage T C-terminal barrel domain-containing protein [Myxococcota bacterium]|nr:glycine cleavage T C-terminal barrel domain-containing protein [Myxococcota bacterium]
MAKTIQELALIRQKVALYERTDIRTLRLSGPDRTRFLNGMVTNDVTKLTDKEALWAVKTNNKGRTEGLLRLRSIDDVIEIETESVVAAKILQILDQYIIMDDCEIADVSSERGVFLFVGAESSEILANLGFEISSDETVEGSIFQGLLGFAIRDRSFGVDGYEVHIPSGKLVEWEQRLSGLNVPHVSLELLEILRVKAGRVRNYLDIDEDTIPLEARLEYAIDFEKGCYVGQEVIARATNLGQVNYLLVGLLFDGEQGDLKTSLSESEFVLNPTDSEKVVGEVTTAVYSPELQRTIALGYVHRKYENVGTRLTCASKSEPIRSYSVEVAALPFE